MVAELLSLFKQWHKGDDMNITVEQIGLGITFLVGLISGIAYLLKSIKTWISKSFKDEFKPINEKIDNLQSRIEEVDMGAVKNYLVTFLSDIEKDNLIDEIERERFWEQYEHYKKIGGNSYIERKVEQLKKEGKL